MAKLLVIGYVWPEPRSSAAGSRIVQLLNSFGARGWDRIFASAAQKGEQRADLSAMNVVEQSIELNSSSFDVFVGELQPDVVIFDRFVTEEQFGWRVAQSCPNAVRVLDTEDLHSLRWARQQWLKERQKACANETERHALGPVVGEPHELFERMASSDLAQREIAAIFRSDLSLMISDFEYELLQRAFKVPGTLLLHTPFMPGTISGVTKNFGPDKTPSFAEREHFVTIGNFRHPPNWDAVLWLKHYIWPQLRARLPTAQLHIYGAYQPAKATALHNPKQGFHLGGWTKDAHQVMSRARVCLAPLRFGAGIKGKLLDAMQCDTPSVTTAIGAEGMAGALSWGGAVTDNAEQLVTEATRFYTEEDQWREAVLHGRRILAERFDSREIADQLHTHIETLRANLTEHRRANFIGAMLGHHLHKSTQYMSQWIEAKSRHPSTTE